jgi:hypothetical protein
MTATSQKIVETSLSLGASGYRSVRAVENVLRFDHLHSSPNERDSVPTLETLLAKPNEAPLLLTSDGTLWQQAELGNRLVTSTRAIAELFDVSPETPLDEIYQKIAAAVDAKADAA